MTPSGMKIHASILVFLALASAACEAAKPPPDLLGRAQQQLTTARSADAATFAPLELRFAEEQLEKATAAMQARDYKQAADLADESEANGELASIKARLGKLRESVDKLKQENTEISRILGEADQDAGAAK